MGFTVTGEGSSMEHVRRKGSVDLVSCTYVGLYAP